MILAHGMAETLPCAAVLGAGYGMALSQFRIWRGVRRGARNSRGGALGSILGGATTPGADFLARCPLT
jgi:hypothetical protein